jgi:hypothetical protein
MSNRKVLAIHAYKFVKVNGTLIASPEAKAILQAAAGKIKGEPGGYQSVLLLGGRDHRSVAEMLAITMEREFRAMNVDADFVRVPALFAEMCYPRDTREEVVLLRHYLKARRLVGEMDEVHSIFCEPWEATIRRAYWAQGIQAKFISVPIKLRDSAARKQIVANLLSRFDPMGEGRISGLPFRKIRRERMQPGDEKKRLLIP